MAKTSSSESSPPSKVDLRTVVKKLEKKYGNLYLPKDTDLLGMALYLLLRENWDYRKAGKATRLLQSEFVDWNELRVTTAGELRTILAPLGDRDVDVKIEKIRTLLLNLYQERNNVSMEFLREEDEEERTGFLGRMRVFSDEQVDILSQLARVPPDDV